MKVCIFGAGAVGGHIATRLIAAKADEISVVARGAQLHPLSAIVQEMRKTEQTSQYLDSLGPFFVGKAIWQSAG